MSSISKHDNKKLINENEKGSFLNLYVTFSCNKIFVHFPNYLCYISSWKAEWDDIRSVQWNSPHDLSATKLSIPSFPAAILSCVQRNSKMRTAKWVNGDRCTLFGVRQYTSQWNWSVRRITYRSSQILVHKSCERSPVSNNIFNLSKL